MDIFLIDTKNNEYVDQGLHPKDDCFDGDICKTNSDIISEVAQENRKVLCFCMESAGFVNYKNEYWHWSYGYLMWAYETKNECTIYNSIDFI